MMQSTNPATGKTVATYPRTAAEEVTPALARAVAAQANWASLSFGRRADYLEKAAQVLRRQAEDLARLMAVEMGKPLAQGRGEANKCAWVCEYYGQTAADHLAERTVPTDAAVSKVAFAPLGVVLAVMPWNFPLWQVFRCAAPALMAGNAVVLKHASNVPGCALAIERIWQEAGLPEGLFKTLLVGAGDVADLIARPEIAGVALTGSTPAGRAVGAAAGRALKPSVLELGGSDPYVVLADADVERAAAICVQARLLNGGQTCIAAKRFIVEKGVAKAFEKAVVDQLRRAVVGDPLVETTTVGPMARHDLRDELHDQVERSIAAGARLAYRGDVPEGDGAWYPVTLLADVVPGMPAFDEELFGPVAAITVADDERHAIALANQTVFGLGAALFTRDLAKGERLATRELQAGCVFVNDFVKSDPRLPFGGIKESGYGRELSVEGIRAFVNVKSVVVEVG